MKHHLIWLALLALVCSAAPAAAKQLVTVEVKNKRDSARKGQRTLRPYAALSEFSIGYGSGSDFKLNALKIQRSNGAAHFALSDRSKDRWHRSFDAKAKWYQRAELRGQTVTLRKRCRVRCTLPLPRSNGFWVLGGFSFKRPGDKKDHVLQVAIKQDSSRRNLEVVFRDGGRNVDFDVVVDLVSVPKHLVHRTRSVKGHSRDGKAVQLGRYRAGEIALLSGFSVRFTNSDHRFRHLSVRACGRRATRCVLFWDQKPDDPVEAELQFAYVRVSSASRPRRRARKRR